MGDLGGVNGEGELSPVASDTYDPREEEGDAVGVGAEP